MNSGMLQALVKDTVLEPAKAARQVLDFEVAPKAVWLGLVLIVVLNGLFYGSLLPHAGGPLMPAAIVESPLRLTGAVGAMLFVTIYLLMFGGRLFGGAASLLDMAQIMVWLQGLRLILQLVVLVLSLAVPLLGWLLSAVAGLWGIWVLVNFIAVAHRFEALKAVATLVLAFVVMIVGLSVLIATVSGVPPQAGEI
ncbi:YIP1 family protein [Pseudooceanicola sp. C21-150M6]|uniref:YIP1 family protein n=1 Tax=Pseudooceanicola sp. C21-150M6 TaxID=3434355 RepID=UPI003D7FD6BA